MMIQRAQIKFENAYYSKRYKTNSFYEQFA